MARKTQRSTLAAQILDCEVSELEEESYDHYGLRLFSCGHKSAAVGNDEECTRAVRAYLKQSLWTFNSKYLAGFTKAGATDAMIDALDAITAKCENGNDTIRSLVSFNDFAKQAVRDGGRGQYLSSYDGEEIEEVIGGIYYFGYRIN